MAEKIIDTSTLKAKAVIADYLFQSDFYQIKNWAFDFNGNTNASKGYNNRTRRYDTLFR